MRYLLLFVFFSGIHLLSEAQTPKVSSGSLRHIEQFPSKYIRPRNIDIWLPDNYNPQKKYAVLYMHDGQMLFDSTNNWNRQEWGVDETMGSLLKEKKVRDCIVVGVWNNPTQRHAEYFPQKAFDYLSPDAKNAIMTERNAYNNETYWGEGPLADNYLRFLVFELKPFVDSAFSVKKDRKNTFIAGSSMGGLISLYAICEYPDVFGGAACLSTHWPGLFRLENNPLPAAIMGYLEEHLPAPCCHKIYFDHGTATLDALYPGLQTQADAILKKKGYTRNTLTRVFPGEDHSERAWARRLQTPLVFLLGR